MDVKGQGGEQVRCGGESKEMEGGVEGGGRMGRRRWMDVENEEYVGKEEQEARGRARADEEEEE